MKGIHFFDLPIEIRLKIYSEVLVQPAPIVIGADKPVPPQSPRTLSVYPELLRIDKRIHSEASVLLYSKNHFQFHDGLWASWTAEVVPFLRQIGSQAQFIRHMCMHFPHFHYTGFGEILMDWHDVKVLEHIRRACKSISTLELFSFGDPFIDYKSHNVSVPSEALTARTRTILSLKQIVIVILVCGEKDVSDESITRLRDYGWIVEIRELKPAKLDVSW
jgi:hypothetical protein